MRRLSALLALTSALASACVADVVDEAPNADDSPMGDSVAVDDASSIGVRVPASLNLDRDRRFYLTFDDGPSSVYTPQILATLRAHNVPAAFFITGTNIAGNEDIIRDELAQGHVIASHQWVHDNATIAQFRQWVPREAEALDRAARQPLPRLFRYPYGAGTAQKEAILRENGYLDGGIGWNVDSLDWCFGNGGTCNRASAAYRSNYVEWVVSEARRIGGGVILFHDIQGVTARNLDAILTRLEALGYTFGALPTAQSPARPPTPETPSTLSCTVSADVANVREQPDGAIINTLRRGAAVSTRTQRGDWYGVTFTVDGRVWGTEASPAYMHNSVLSCR